ncbi:hypothetical protein LY76DRAFT_117837 [Colletotrichum caudatum]|nr:hypothetical protein LY76DRAFT_117837 [Colletotrichum caudatum]
MFPSPSLHLPVPYTLSPDNTEREREKEEKKRGPVPAALDARPYMHDSRRLRHDLQTLGPLVARLVDPRILQIHGPGRSCRRHRPPPSSGAGPLSIPPSLSSSCSAVGNVLMARIGGSIRPNHQTNKLLPPRMLENLAGQYLYSTSLVEVDVVSVIKKNVIQSCICKHPSIYRSHPPNPFWLLVRIGFEPTHESNKKEKEKKSRNLIRTIFFLPAQS